MACRQHLIAALLVTVGTVHCGQTEPSDKPLDLVGVKPQVVHGPTVKPAVPQAAADLPPVIDLIQDILFRHRRDGWTFTSKEADFHVDKLIAGNVGVVLAAIPQPTAGEGVPAILRAMDEVAALASATAGKVVVAGSFSEALAAHKDKGAVGLLFLLEGADALDGRLDVLKALKARGLVAIGLVAGHSNGLAEAAVDPREHGGLLAKGLALVKACREAGIAVDLTHASAATFWDVLDATGGTALVSHSNVRALREHVRNLSDLQIVALGRYGGLLGLLFNPDFLVDGTRRATRDDVVAQVLHVRALGAISALALGTDYGGIIPPTGLEDVSALSSLGAALDGQRLLAHEIEGLLAANATRFFVNQERVFDASQPPEQELLRPVPLECTGIVGRADGAPDAVCDGLLASGGPVFEPGARQKLRIKDSRMKAVRLELYGEPGVPWQIEVQNVAGKVLQSHMVSLDERGQGSLELPSQRASARIFCAPTRPSALHEAVVWGKRVTE